MGQDWCPNKAIPTELLLLLLESTDLRVQEVVLPGDRNRWLLFHTYIVTCYTLLLRGCEGFLLDLSALKQVATSTWSLHYLVKSKVSQVTMFTCCPVFQLLPQE
jgi:hypothetical protein